MKKIILMFIFAVCFICNASAQWTSTAIGESRYQNYRHTYTIDEGTFWFDTNVSGFNINLNNDKAEFNKSDYISFGYFLTEIQLFNESNIRVKTITTYLYCDKTSGSMIHSAINSEIIRNIMQFITDDKGYVKFIMPSQSGEDIQFIVLCQHSSLI